MDSCITALYSEELVGNCSCTNVLALFAVIAGEANELPCVVEWFGLSSVRRW